MPHIKLDDSLPGIRSLLEFSPDTATPIAVLTNILMRSNEGLTRGERELIAAHVSRLNDCFYCYHSHSALAACYLNQEKTQVDATVENVGDAPLSDKMKALLNIAAAVQQSGKAVTIAQIDTAKMAAATDREIHDTVLIAALFCMFNRYVDGLATNTPTDILAYMARAEQVSKHGYHK